MKKQLWLDEHERALLIVSIDYWMEQLNAQYCPSSPHKKAKIYYFAKLKKLRHKISGEEGQ